jgi:hypothetical protein
MAYVTKNSLVSRAGYSGVLGRALGAWTDTVKDIFGGALNFYGAQQKAQGAAQQAQSDLAVATRGGGGLGLSLETLVLLGGVGTAAYFLLRKKKAASP